MSDPEKVPNTPGLKRKRGRNPSPKPVEALPPIDLSSLEKSISEVQKVVGQVADVVDKVLPLISRLTEFQNWARSMPNGKNPVLPQSPQGSPVPVSWTPPSHYVELSGMNGKCVEALPEYKGGVDSIRPVKVVLDPSGKQTPEVGEVRVGNRVLYWKPEPLGAMVGRIWADPETAEIVRTWKPVEGEVPVGPS